LEAAAPFGFFWRGAGALERAARALGGAGFDGLGFDDLRTGFGSLALSSLIFLDLVESAAAGPEFRKLDAPGQLCLVIITLSLDADLGHGFSQCRWYQLSKEKTEMEFRRLV
jgi:hypothetical protein